MNEIKEIKDKIEKKKIEISSLEKKLQSLMDNQEVPDIVGKYIFLKNSPFSTCIKVSNIIKSKELGWLIEGKSIETYMQLIRTTYTIKNWSCYPISDIDNIKFITENEFNKLFEEAIKSFNNN